MQTLFLVKNTDFELLSIKCMYAYLEEKEMVCLSEEKMCSMLKEIKRMIGHSKVGDFKWAHINQPFGRHAKEFLDISWNNFYNADIIFFLLSFNITEIRIAIKLISIYTEKILKKYVYILQDYTAPWKFCYTRITDHIMALYKYNRRHQGSHSRSTGLSQ